MPAKSKLTEITVRLSPDQLARFNAGSKSYGVEVGDVLLALAYDRLQIGEGDPMPLEKYMQGLLWKFVHKREDGVVNQWGDAGFFTDEETEERDRQMGLTRAAKGGSDHA